MDAVLISNNSLESQGESLFTTRNENGNHIPKEVLFVPYYMITNYDSDVINVTILDKLDAAYNKDLEELLLTGRKKIKDTYWTWSGFTSNSGISDRLGMSSTDVNILMHVDNYIKTKIGYYSSDTGFTNPATVIESDTIDKVKDNLSYKGKEIVDVDSILLRKQDKPYTLHVRSNIIYVSMREGFFEALMTDPIAFRRLLYTDVVREYQNIFGTKELYSSVLFNMFLLNLDKMTRS